MSKQPNLRRHARRHPAARLALAAACAASVAVGVVACKCEDKKNVPPPHPETVRVTGEYIKSLREVLARSRPEAALRFIEPLRADRSFEDFSQPEVAESRDGTLDLTLKVGTSLQTVGIHRVLLRTYNDKIVGPTMLVEPGDVLAVTVQNTLPPDQGECSPGMPNSETEQPPDCPVAGPSHNDPSHFRPNDTNLHVHGLHVSPMGVSDNVLLTICPGQSQDYRIEIPATHHPGTFWYHAHKHGATAIQLGNGMSGAIIIKGGIDSVPAIAGARDRLFVMQQIPYTMCTRWTARGTDRTCAEAKPIGSVDWPQVADTWDMDTNFGEERATTVNGIVQPALLMKKGAVERWRLLHAGIRENISLTLLSQKDYDFVVGELETRSKNTSHAFEWPAGESLHRIAIDGLATRKLQDLRQIELTPGNRADILFKAPLECEGGGDTCIYYLVDRERNAGLKGWESSQLLATITVGPETSDMPLPTEEELRQACGDTCAPTSLADATVEDADRQTVTFAEGFGSNYPYNINGKAFSPCVSRKLRLGKVGEWTLTTDAKAPANWNHPFHIHVNPFQLLDIRPAEGEELTEADRADIGLFRDVLLVRRGWVYTVRSKYETFTGAFVLHCHILNHEDQGMMEIIRVVDE